MQRGIYDIFVAKVVEAVKQFIIGNAFDEGVTDEPLIYERAIRKGDEHLRDSVAKGANSIYGGKALPDLGPNFYDTTILTGMDMSVKLCDEETFGPVTALFVFDTEVEMANDSDVGLAAYFFSKDASRCWRMVEALEIGMVGINTGKQFRSMVEFLLKFVQVL